MKTRGVVLVPLLIMIGAIVAFGMVTFAVVQSYQTKEVDDVTANTANNAVLTNLNANGNTNATINSNTASTNSNNTNQSQTNVNPVNESIHRLAVARAGTNGAYSMKEVDVTTGKVVREAALQLESSSLPTLGTSANDAGVQFSADGRAIMYKMDDSTYDEGENYSKLDSGLYLTSWADPKSVTPIVRYTEGGIIENWYFDSERNRAYYFLAETNGETPARKTGHVTLYVVDVFGKVRTEIAVYAKLPDYPFVAVDGQSITNIILANTQAYYYTNGTATIETVAIPSGATNTKIVNNPGMGTSHESLSPNAEKFISWKFPTQGDPLTIWSVADGQTTAAEGVGEVLNIKTLWSPDSSKIFLVTRDGGKILDVTAGVIKTLPEVEYPFIASPGNYFIYTSADLSIWAYSIATQQTVKLDLGQHNPDDFVGMGWISS